MIVPKVDNVLEWKQCYKIECGPEWGWWLCRLVTATQCWWGERSTCYWVDLTCRCWCWEVLCTWISFSFYCYHMTWNVLCNVYWSNWLWTGHFFGQQYNAGGGGKRPGVVSDDETQVEVCLSIASWKLVKARNWNSQGARRELTLYQND